MMAAASRKNVNTYHHALCSDGFGLLEEPLTLAISTHRLEFLPYF